MTSYEVVNQDGEVVAVVVKFDNDRCLVQYTQTIFDSIDALGQHLNNSAFQLQEVSQGAAS